MEKQIVLIGINGSPLLTGISERLGASGFSCHMLSIDAPLEGKPLTVANGRVLWEGVELMYSAAIFVELPLFPWPQTRLPADSAHKGLPRDKWAQFQREAGSLVVSALSVAAVERPMLNPPEDVHLAVSPAIALDRLAETGIAVHPWRLAVPLASDDLEAGFAIDSCGRDRWYSPRKPCEGESAILYEPVAGKIVSFLVVGTSCAGAIEYPGAAVWAERHSRETGDEDTGPGGSGDGAAVQKILQAHDIAKDYQEEADLAARAANALGLGFAAISIAAGLTPSEVLLCEASPDLTAWDRMLEGGAAAAAADHLISVAGQSPSAKK